MRNGQAVQSQQGIILRPSMKSPNKFYYCEAPETLGEVFAATKISIIVFLVGFFGVPSLFTIVNLICLGVYKEPLLVEWYALGVMQFDLTISPQLISTFPIQFAVLLESMTPAEKAFGTGLFWFSILLALVLGLAALRIVSYLSTFAVSKVWRRLTRTV